MGKKRKERDHAVKEGEEESESAAKRQRREEDVPSAETGEASGDAPSLEMKATKPDDQATDKKTKTTDVDQEAQEKMQLLVSAFTNAQQDQYEIFRRATFPKSSVRRIMQNVCSSSIPPNAVIAMAGITKVYVGEIVEAACLARDVAGEEGPLLPKHIREAVRRLRGQGKVPNSRYKKIFPFK